MLQCTNKHTNPAMEMYFDVHVCKHTWYICKNLPPTPPHSLRSHRTVNNPRNYKTSNMPYDDCELTRGVTFEELPETEFSRHVDSVKHGWVRLQPYNQVCRTNYNRSIMQVCSLDMFPFSFRRSPKHFYEIRRRWKNSSAVMTMSGLRVSRKLVSKGQK